MYTDEKVLSHYFSQYGKLENVQIVYDKKVRFTVLKWFPLILDPRCFFFRLAVLVDLDSFISKA